MRRSDVRLFRLLLPRPYLIILYVIANGLGIYPEETKSRYRLDERSSDHIRLIRGPLRKVKELPEIYTPIFTDLATYV